MGYLGSVGDIRELVEDLRGDLDRNRSLIRKWTKDGPKAARESLPRMTGQHRTHAMQSLRRHTEYKQGKYLLFRGVSEREFRAVQDGLTLRYSKRSSWTPYQKQADGFAVDYKGRTLSAWVPESAVVTIPNEYRAASYGAEHEVVLGPGRFEMVGLNPPKK